MFRFFICKRFCIYKFYEFFEREFLIDFFLPSSKLFLFLFFFVSNSHESLYVNYYMRILDLLDSILKNVQLRFLE